MAFCIGLAVVSLPVLTQWLHLTPALQRFVFYARWPVVGAMFWLSLLVIYRYGPSRAHANWYWVSWGAMIATALWLSGSGILAWYVAGASSYQHAYGSVGTIVLVLAWFLVSRDGPDPNSRVGSLPPITSSSLLGCPAPAPVSSSPTY